MTNQNGQNQNPVEAQKQGFQNEQNAYLEQYADIVEAQALETARKIRDERLAYYEAKAIEEARAKFKEETEQILQSRLQEINRYHAKAVVESRANTPQPTNVEGINLEAPSLDEAIEQEHHNYGVLVGGNAKQQEIYTAQSMGLTPREISEMTGVSQDEVEAVIN